MITYKCFIQVLILAKGEVFYFLILRQFTLHNLIFLREISQMKRKRLVFIYFIQRASLIWSATAHGTASGEHIFFSYTSVSTGYYILSNRNHNPWSSPVFYYPLVLYINYHNFLTRGKFESTSTKNWSLTKELNSDIFDVSNVFYLWEKCSSEVCFEMHNFWTNKWFIPVDPAMGRWARHQYSGVNFCQENN